MSALLQKLLALIRKRGIGMTTQQSYEDQSSKGEGSERAGSSFTIFDYEELQEATNFFDQSLIIAKERDGGVVYRGKLRNGKIVAVKKLRGYDPERFMNRVKTLSCLHHESLVTVYGCNNPERDEKQLLVYEFVPSDSVADFLHQKHRTALSWAQRMEIAIQTAEAVTYLHSFEPPIIHGDITTDNLKIKVAGSGCLLNLGDWSYEDIRETSKSRLFGLAEWKRDVDSFGVVLLELVLGRRVVVVQGIDYQNQVPNWRKKQQLKKLVDPELFEYNLNQDVQSMVTLVVKLASRCLQSWTSISDGEVLLNLKNIKNGKQLSEPTITLMTADSINEGATDTILPAVGDVRYITEVSEDLTEEASQIDNFDLPFGFKFGDIMMATNYFNPSEVIGQGRHGEVYRGNLNGLKVAVKRLKTPHFYPHQTKQFLNDAWDLYRFRHKNFVLLYGCTSPEDEELFLVYEFVPNGTVADHLNCKPEDNLSWVQRIKIAIQAAKALVYLHSLPIPVIHGDFKTDNLLLDNNFNVKVGDFGLRRLLYPDESLMVWASGGAKKFSWWSLRDATTKSDVNSFGVVLVELITGKKALDPLQGTDNEFNIQYPLLGTNNEFNIQWVQSMLLNLVDSQLRDHFEQVTLLADLAKSCLQFEAEKRPSMPEILLILKAIRGMKQDATTSTESLPVAPEVLRHALVTAYHDNAQVEDANDTIASVVDDTNDIEVAPSKLH